MLTTERQAAVMQQRKSVSGIATGASTWAVGTASCPDDCHYCSGPETD
ncbi:hypothetical protein [Arthrobacter sp. ok362]|jgi:pyruvate-formate lyase-activating enzyme|nr:hypothetical protein [Arthrobacter sp. ok362]SDL33517.1 hypothetical protein SAMN04487913_108130 [Arthrobacter sp. ok362]